MLRTHQGRADRAPTPANDVVALQNEQVVYEPNDYRNPLREVKHHREPMKDYFNQVEHWLGRRTGSEMCEPNTLGTEEAGMYQSFSGLLNYFKNFYLSCFAQISNKIQSISNKFQKPYKITSHLKMLKNFKKVM